MFGFSGVFETHLTVDAGADDDRLAAWAQRNGAKFTRIRLDRGATPDQPMLTFSGRGVLADHITAAAELSTRLAADVETTVVRIKVEASPFNVDVPATDADVAGLPPECHFEHHVKVALADDADLDALRTVAVAHGAHVSRNARRSRDNGGHERFITQRCYRTGRAEAGAALDALVAALAVEVLEVEREYVVHDGNPALDHGWLTA